LGLLPVGNMEGWAESSLGPSLGLRSGFERTFFASSEYSGLSVSFESMDFQPILAGSFWLEVLG
jgi:hypothetical protein